MAINQNDIAALTTHLNGMLAAMREYHQLTVDLLNCDIEQAEGYLKERQRLIDEVNQIESEVHEVLYRVSGAATEDNFGKALGKLIAVTSSDMNDVIALATQLAEAFRDISVIDAKLLANIEKEREAMVAELKSVTDRRRVAHTPYFDAKTQPIGSAYDKKK